MAEKAIKVVVAENIKRLMDCAKEEGSLEGTVRGLAGAAGCSVGSVQRLLAGDTSIGVAIIDGVARALGLRAQTFTARPSTDSRGRRLRKL